MKARYARELNTLVFCRGVLDNHAPLVGDINSSGSRAELDAAIQAISELAAEQELGKRQRTAFRLAAKKATRDLRRAMRPVAEVAKSNFQRVPEFEALYMPRVSIGTQSLVAAANAMANAAQPLTRTFLDAGLSAAFMDNIRARATSLTEITGNQAHAGVVRSGATAGIRAAIKRGRRAVAVIDALLIPMNHSLRSSGAQRGICSLSPASAVRSHQQDRSIAFGARMSDRFFGHGTNH